MVDLNWLLGFIEGEGCFTIGLTRNKSAQFGYQIQPSFVIKLTLSEEQVLEEIKHTLGVGRTYYESSALSRNKGMKNANDCVSLRITKLKELEKLIDMLDPLFFVSSAKRADFNVWRDCIKLIQKGDHRKKEGFLRIAEMRDKLHKRKQWNKKNYCIIRQDVDPCLEYKKKQKLKNCSKCKTYEGYDYFFDEGKKTK